MGNRPQRDASVAYNEGAVWEYGWLIEFTEEGSSNSGSVESERTNIFVAIINKEIDLILNQYYLQARDPKVGAYCVRMEEPLCCRSGRTIALGLVQSERRRDRDLGQCLWAVDG